MSHPDAAWSPYYIAPTGIEGEPCRHAMNRQRIGPTSRRRCWMILVDECGWCGWARAVDALTWEQFSWLRRRNQRFALTPPKGEDQK